MLTDGRTDVRTDERTNGRKLARLCLPAKARATKNSIFRACLEMEGQGHWRETGTVLPPSRE